MAVKVLILEDNPAAREFLGRVVRESFSDTITIVEAGDLESARRAIRIAGGAQGYHGVDPFKLVLCDLELPDGSGLELLEELRQYPATKVVTTLYSDDEHLFPALQSGADGYLLKEDRFELLVEELQKIVRGEPPLSPAIARRLLGHFRTNTRTGMNRRITDEGNGAALRAPTASSTFTAVAFAAPSPVVIEPALDLPALTPREVEVLTFLSKGFTIKEIAALMSIKWFTVNDHIKSIYRKLNVSSRAEAAVLASKQGLV
jgi:two-component system, NarL family, nitrate/nitrite response regulator NarL